MRNTTVNIRMVDLQSQYLKIKEEVNTAIQEVIDSGQFVKGGRVTEFENNLADYLQVGNVISCGNGTDALQIALMALDTKPGDEVLVPAHTYIATAEAVALLGLVPVLVDVDPETFNIDVQLIESKITEKTKVILPVHLYGQSADMEAILALAMKHDLKVIEDNAQAIGAVYTFGDGRQMRTGTMGDIGTTSFYPSKNLGCYGDGGAIFTKDDALAEKIRMIANHGQKKTYYHELIGVNSRLDPIQAVVLNIKLRHLESYNEVRNNAANYYDRAFMGMEELVRPVRYSKSSHVFHQYTIKVSKGVRDDFKLYLKDRGIPSMIYYPLPMYKQKAFEYLGYDPADYPVSEGLCKKVISLPIHSELEEDELSYICDSVKSYFS